MPDETLVKGFYFMTYSEKLKDPRWQRKRLEILNRDNWKCTNCGNDKLNLHVHHEKYFGEPWEIDNSKLKTICHKCHEIEHGIGIKAIENKHKIGDVIKLSKIWGLENNEFKLTENQNYIKLMKAKSSRSVKQERLRIELHYENIIDILNEIKIIENKMAIINENGRR